MENLELEYGVALGLYGGLTVLGLVDVAGGLRYDLICVGYADGKLFHHQAQYEGLEVGIAQILDFDVHSSQTIRDNPFICVPMWSAGEADCGRHRNELRLRC